MIKDVLGAWRRQFGAAAQNSTRAKDRRVATSARAASPWHAISVETGRPCCKAATDLAGTRFLQGSVPDLPLPGCDLPVCQCHYRHHSDRRVSGLSLERIGVSLPNLRRRATD